MRKKLLIHAWSIEKKGNKYFLPFSHWIYLKEIVKYYDEVVLLSSCIHLEGNETCENIEITSIENVSVYELPAARSYVSAIKHFFSYLKGYRSITGVTTYYSRYPTPFGWLQKIYGKNKERIIHYVGDPADVTKNNPSFNKLKKIILLSGFSLEVVLYRWACKGAKVYTNGHHLAEKLQKKKIPAIPLISSTLNDSDFHFAEKTISPENANFIYLGYLRTAKGVETVIKAFALYNKKYPNSTFTIIGSGELEDYLKNIVTENHIDNVRFLGHIDQRKKLNKELRTADIFLFASLSEGSPRVILEAMANGLAVISTPVGSLPTTFTNKEDILFADFNSPEEFFKAMIFLAGDNTVYNNIRISSFKKAQSHTITKFIKRIFNE